MQTPLRTLYMECFDLETTSDFETVRKGSWRERSVFSESCDMRDAMLGGRGYHG